MTSQFAVSVAFTFGMQLVGFLAAYALQTETFYDVFGGLNFIAIALYTFFESDTGWGWNRQTLASAFFVVSRGWLLVFLAYRAHARKGDSRFDGVKDKFGLFLVYWMVQASWCYIISMPLIFINDAGPREPDALTGFDWTFLALFAVAVFVEIIADIQKTLWVENGRQGGFCAVGLWNYSRHPNYFGEILQWWALWVVASGSVASDDGKLWLWILTILSPLYTMHILLNLSGTGVWNAEGKNLKRYYDNPDCRAAYMTYRESTSILIPMIGYKNIPMSVKRVLLFEWERYEYKDESKNE